MHTFWNGRKQFDESPYNGGIALADSPLPGLFAHMSDARSDDIKLISTNRQAHHRYHIMETYEAGLVLQGTEVKSLRAGKCNLKEGYARIDNEEAWLIGVHIPEYAAGNQFNHDPVRKRKLLLSKRQIHRLMGQTQQQGLTIVPLRIYFSGKRVKVELGLGKGKKLFDKRQAIIKRDTDRQMRRETFRRR